MHRGILICDVLLVTAAILIDVFIGIEMADADAHRNKIANLWIDYGKIYRIDEYVVYILKSKNQFRDRQLTVLKHFRKCRPNTGIPFKLNVGFIEWTKDTKAYYFNTWTIV